MQTSKTFTTPRGAKVATRANKTYAVVLETDAPDDKIYATVVLRTDNLARAEGYLRLEGTRIRRGASLHLFRKADGALLASHDGVWTR